MANGRPVVDSGTAARGWTWVRACLLIVPMSIIVPLLLITCLAAGLSLTVSGFVVAFVVLLALPCATRLLPARLTYDRAGHRFLFALWVALSLFVSFRVTTMSIFMLDAQKVQYAVNSTIHTLWTVSNPETKKPTHNCFTASAIAVHLAAQNVENIYRRNHYFAPLQEGTAFRKTIGDTFTIDPYQYPPPFLILPRLILAIGPDFFQARTYWFVLNVLVCGAAVAVLVSWLGGYEFNVYWLTCPSCSQRRPCSGPYRQGTFTSSSSLFPCWPWWRSRRSGMDLEEPFSALPLYRRSFQACYSLIS